MKAVLTVVVLAAFAMASPWGAATANAYSEGGDYGGSDYGGSDYGGSDYGGSDYGGGDYGGYDSYDGGYDSYDSYDSYENGPAEGEFGEYGTVGDFQESPADLDGYLGTGSVYGDVSTGDLGDVYGDFYSSTPVEESWDTSFIDEGVYTGGFPMTDLDFSPGALPEMTTFADPIAFGEPTMNEPTTWGAIVDYLGLGKMTIDLSGITCAGSACGTYGRAYSLDGRVTETMGPVFNFTNLVGVPSGEASIGLSNKPPEVGQSVTGTAFIGSMEFDEKGLPTAVTGNIGGRGPVSPNITAYDDGRSRIGVSFGNVPVSLSHTETREISPSQSGYSQVRGEGSGISEADADAISGINESNWANMAEVAQPSGNK